MSHITIGDIFNYVINYRYVLMSDVELMATIFMTNSIVELIRNMFWPLFAETPCKIGAAIAPNRKFKYVGMAIHSPYRQLSYRL